MDLLRLLVWWLVEGVIAWSWKGRHAQLKRRLRRCGRGVRFNGRIVVSEPSAVILEDNVHIGDNAFIKSEGGLRVGANTHISRNLTLYTVNHEFEGDRLPYDSTFVSKPVSIGRNAWIGMDVKIAPGTTIGDGAIVALGATVSGDVPPCAIVGAPGWRVLGHRDERHYDRLEREGRYGGVNGEPWPSRDE